VRLAPVVRSYGVAPVSAARIATRSNGSSSTSATIWESTVRLPWPSSVAPTAADAEPSACRRTIATEVGCAPASEAVMPKPTAASARCSPPHPSDVVSMRRSSARSASMPRLPGRISSPGATTLRSRSASASIPSRSAASSICSSPAKLPCGAPNPRSELAGTVLVKTDRTRTRTAGMRYGPKQRFASFAQTTGLLSV